MTTDPDKMMNDLTDLILARVLRSFGENILHSFEARLLRNDISDLITKYMDISEEAFDTAFEEGEEKGREEGLQDAREKLRNFADNF